MTRKLRALDLQVKQFQDFTPTPGTLSTAMYVTGLHRDTDRPIPVARNRSERKEQRGLLERQMAGSGQRAKQTAATRDDSRMRGNKK